jgi:hypothetical protein
VSYLVSHFPKPLNNTQNWQDWPKVA